MAEQLEIAAHGITAILGTWLGLTVAVRARRLPAARVFGLLTLYLVIWSVAVIVQRISPEALVDLVTDKGLRRELRPYVEKELVLVA